MRGHVTMLQDRNVTNWFVDLVVPWDIYTRCKEWVDMLGLEELLHAECW